LTAICGRLRARRGYRDSRPDNAYLHYHCVVIGGVFDSATTGGLNFHLATGLDEQAFAAVQERVRLLRVFVRRGLLPGDDARAMGQWAHGGGFSPDGSARIEAENLAGRKLSSINGKRSP
jgi:hypothetical protein